MPNCFQLIRKSNPQAGPVILQVVDEEMCKHFNVRCDPKRWYYEWYNTIGFALAMGSTFNTLRAEYTIDGIGDEKYIEIIDWLDANFTADAWAEISRR